MTPQQIELVKATVPVLRENGVALTGYFYNRMLGNNPALKETFNMGHQRSGAQAQALAGAVLAYAENIEDPSVLLPVVELIAHKHVSLNIQAPDYSIVGENLLHSISEVLDVPFESDLIEAWKQAYLQLADILIGAEQQKYDQLASQSGGWSGWRNFKIVSIQDHAEGKFFNIRAADQQTIPTAQAGEYISVKVHVPEKGIDQPQQFSFSSTQDTAQYGFLVKSQAEHSEYDVANILLSHYQVGDELAVSAPLKG